MSTQQKLLRASCEFSTPKFVSPARRVHYPTNFAPRFARVSYTKVFFPQAGSQKVARKNTWSAKKAGSHMWIRTSWFVKVASQKLLRTRPKSWFAKVTSFLKVGSQKLVCQRGFCKVCYPKLVTKTSSDPYPRFYYTTKSIVLFNITPNGVSAGRLYSELC